MASSAVPGTPTSDETTATASSTNPLTLMSMLEPSKKYTLVFLVSVGATLLVTGASGGRLLKRAKKMSAEPPLPPAPTITRVPKLTTATKLVTPSTSSQRSKQSLLDLATSFPPIEPPQRSLLRQWSQDKGADLSFWLPNASLLASSAEAAAKAEQYDKLQEGEDVEQPYVDDGFNPAVYAAKAFGIASLITIGTFAAGIFAVMKYFGVSDLESLSLALSHRLPPVLDAHRPEIPAWALPTPKVIEKPGEEEENEEHKDGVAYWVEVQETLDREAAERLVERAAKWEKIKAAKS